MIDQFDAYAEYYNLFYEGKDYKGESEYVHQLIETHHKGALKVLELGCGSGGHARELLKYGYSIHGVDISSRMLEQAKLSIRNDGAKVSFSLGDARTLALNKKFDVVLSLFHVLGYQNSDEDVLKTFLTAYEHLKPGGLFIYDFWYGPTVLSDGPSTRVLKIKKDHQEILRISEPNMDLENHLCKINYSIFVKEATGLYKRIDELHSMRYFFQDEFMHFESNKFICLDELAWMSQLPLAQGNWYGVRICKKPSI
jgi:SAM-dependent methyltransferase